MSAIPEAAGPRRARGRRTGYRPGRLLAVTAAGALLGAMVLVPAGTALAGTLNTGAAPGCCGTSATWSPGDKTFLGRAEAPTAAADDVWFTGTNGILTELFYPNLDTPDFTDQQFIVGDANHTWDQEEKTDSTHTVAQVQGDSMAWTVTNTGSNGRWKLAKTIYTDPGSPVVDEKVTFTVTSGDLGNYTLYQLSNPTQEGNGNDDTGTTATYDSRQMLVSSGSNTAGTATDASAIAVGDGLNWLSSGSTPMLSSGFEGVDDGWTDLLGGSTPDYTMNDAYSSATGGNLVQTGELNLAPVATQTSVTFNLVIGMGATTTAAESAADAELTGLTSSPTGVETSYNNQWSTWAAGLNSYSSLGGEQYLVSAMGIKASQDPSSGAIVAGMGSPWGDSQNTSDAGYHRTWSRDLFNSATALILAGDNADADSAAKFLFNDQQESDGHFPQNSFVNGTPSWTGVQMDETAYPIILAWQLRTYDSSLVSSSFYTAHIRPAAEYLIAHGPSTPMERWEENSGYSPSTIAAEIAGLYLASQIASADGQSADATTFADDANSWAAQVENWTYATSGPFGNGQYFERISRSGNPNDGTNVTVANGGGTYNENAVVDDGFLQLVVLGILPADDLHVANTIAVTADPNAGESAGSLEELLPDGTDFFRYNHDGYGETSTGGDFVSSGIGRLWPILDGEFGQYQDLLGDHVAPYVADLQHYATPSYLIPEQVWDQNAPTGDTPGTPTLSMSALNWSLSMYIQLVAAEYGQQHSIAGLPGTPAAVSSHFAAALAEPVTTSPSPAVAGQPVTVTYDGSLAASATSITMHWGYDNWLSITNTAMTKQANGTWTATVTVPAGTGLNTAFYNQASTWDSNSGNNYNIGSVNSPVSASPDPVVGGQSATIRYNGSLAASATSITLHWGDNGWQGVTNTAMTKQADGSWKATITVPAGSSLNLAFYNQAGTWDSNGGVNYGFAIR
ncbi:MAG TPA: carbohydrate-binding protein [Actinocrinis sp.]|nr:carbohydrate-binding protein [Actinocrinis sp.]